MYNRKVVSPRCLFKIDLQKDYDTVEWDIVEQILKGFQFPYAFTQKFMVYDRTTSVSLCLNRSRFGYLKGKRGLRQGIFLIPKSVIKRIEAICRNFLWARSSDYHRVPLVAWDTITLPKTEGGLGIKRALT
ncbi:uncharacterized protein LOC141630885 [Silene latifolia]|uniref:uncharacterized protein LOC141630885 n=1 Tax=Silene latifolia TaxID=37657 RepID=UPI003D77EE4E